MFCKFCGKELSESAKFCDGCGKPVADEYAVTNIEEKKTKKKKKRHPILGTILLVFGIIMLAVSCGGMQETTNTQPKISKDEYIQMCKTISYKELARNPESFKGEYFTFTGEVIQVMEQGNLVNLRVNVTSETLFDTTFYTDTIFVVARLSEDGNRILEHDIITLYGICDGLYTYTTVLGSEMSIPRIDVEYWEIAK